MTEALKQAAQAARIWINHDLRDVSVHQQDEPGWVEFEVQTGGIAAQATPEPECARSHPHENMSATCELRTEIARLRNENTRLKAATPKPFAAPGRWFPVDVLGNPMREFEPGKWEVALWPSATPEPVGEPVGTVECYQIRGEDMVLGYLPRPLPVGTKLYTRPAPGVTETDADALLDFMEAHRVSVTPEYEGQWCARQYDDEPQAVAEFEAATPRDAIRALAAAQAKGWT